MRRFILGLLLGVSLAGNWFLASRAMGISMDGISCRSLIAAVLLAGTVTDRQQAYATAERLIAGK